MKEKNNFHKKKYYIDISSESNSSNNSIMNKELLFLNKKEIKQEKEKNIDNKKLFIYNSPNSPKKEISHQIFLKEKIKQKLTNLKCQEIENNFLKINPNFIKEEEIIRNKKLSFLHKDNDNIYINLKNDNKSSYPKIKLLFGENLNKNLFGTKKFEQNKEKFFCEKIDSFENKNMLFFNDKFINNQEKSLNSLSIENDFDNKSNKIKSPEKMMFSKKFSLRKKDEKKKEIEKAFNYGNSCESDVKKKEDLSISSSGEQVIKSFLKIINTAKGVRKYRKKFMEMNSYDTSLICRNKCNTYVMVIKLTNSFNDNFINKSFSFRKEKKCKLKEKIFV